MRPASAGNSTGAPRWAASSRPSNASRRARGPASNIPSGSSSSRSAIGRSVIAAWPRTPPRSSPCSPRRTCGWHGDDCWPQGKCARCSKKTIRSPAIGPFRRPFRTCARHLDTHSFGIRSKQLFCRCSLALKGNYCLANRRSICHFHLQSNEGFSPPSSACTFAIHDCSSYSIGDPTCNTCRHQT